MWAGGPAMPSLDEPQAEAFLGQGQMEPEQVVFIAKHRNTM
jgi:hypothetical protein